MMTSSEGPSQPCLAPPNPKSTTGKEQTIDLATSNSGTLVDTAVDVYPIHIA